MDLTKRYDAAKAEAEAKIKELEALKDEYLEVAEDLIGNAKDEAKGIIGWIKRNAGVLAIGGFVVFVGMLILISM
jgi:hypothetical protein